MMQVNSIQINDKKLIQNFLNIENFPYLISFPRTGSHWLRMIMELYFERPSLVRIFYYMDAKDFTCYHRHDDNLSIQHKNVIYLYRNPVDTIYSQISYYNESLEDASRIRYWADLYGRHLSKWLIEENFTTKKTILTYEGMRSNLGNEFKKICEHFETPYLSSKLIMAAEKVNKEEVKGKTAHDPQVINRKNDYEIQRIDFRYKYSELILSLISEVNVKLSEFILIS
jgi:hypothetical protein